MKDRFAFALCADDYAITPGVSRGIREALDAGALTATSAMTSTEAWPEEAAALRRFVGSVDIGLHLNLTLGRPLGTMSRLAPNGIMPPVGALIRAALRDELPLDEIAAEIRRQCDAFFDAMGRPPDHVDGHQHVHVLAGIRRPLVAALGERGWKPWLRDSGDRPFRILRRRATLAKAATVALIARGFAAQVHQAGLETNEGFAGFSSFAGTGEYATEFERYLTAPGTAHLVMCHPGYVDDALRRVDPVQQSRERELAFLLSADHSGRFVREGAILERMSTVLANPARL